MLSSDPLGLRGATAGEAALSSHYRSVLIGSVLIARWFRAPQRRPMEALVATMTEARKQASRPLLYCAYIGGDAELLTSPSRRILAEFEPKILQQCESIHVVFAGAGTAVKMLLTIRRAMNVLAPHRSRVFLHTSLESFLATAGTGLGATHGSIAQAVDSLLAPGART